MVTEVIEEALWAAGCRHGGLGHGHHNEANCPLLADPAWAARQEAIAKDGTSEKSRSCQSCGTYGEAWAVWTDPKSEFMWQCDPCRRDPEKRFR